MSAAPDARVVLRARSVLESADLALRFAVAHVRVLARLSAVVALPGFALSVALRYALGLDWWVVWCIAVALAAACEGPFTVLLGQLALGPSAGVADALRGFRSRALPFVTVMLGAAILQAAAASMLFVPWVFAALSTVFVPEVTLLEGGRLGAFKRSAKVTTGFTGRAFGVVVLLLMARLTAVSLADVVLRRTIGVLLDLRIHSEALFEDGGSAYALAGLWFSVPVCATIRYFQYIDLRTLKEGWDLQRRFQLLAGRLRAEATS